MFDRITIRQQYLARLTKLDLVKLIAKTPLTTTAPWATYWYSQARHYAKTGMRTGMINDKAHKWFIVLQIYLETGQYRPIKGKLKDL